MYFIHGKIFKTVKVFIKINWKQKKLKFKNFQNVLFSFKIVYFFILNLKLRVFSKISFKLFSPKKKYYTNIYGQ